MTEAVETEQDAATLPVWRYADAAPYLRRPFTRNAVKFKVQAAWDGGALIVAYIDARLVIERLNTVIPDWSDADAYKPIGQKHMSCRLTVGGVSREDVGEGQGKALYSDAFKRAAVKFGVGVSLYAIPKIILNDKDGHLSRKRRGGKDVVEITDSGLARCRDIYGKWLEGPGRAFGEPLDHGDVEDAAGDLDAVPEQAAPEQADLSDMAVTEEYAKGVVNAVWKAGLQKQLQLAIQHVTRRDDVPAATTKAGAAKVIAEYVNSGQVASIERWVARHEEEGS